MPQLNDLYAGTPTGDTVTFATQRYFNAGAVQARIKDITRTITNASGDTVEVSFQTADYRIGVYRRAGGNSMLVASKVIRKTWGVWTGWVTLGNVAAGTYSFQTQLVAMNGMPIARFGDDYTSARFDIIHA